MPKYGPYDKVPNGMTQSVVVKITDEDADELRLLAFDRNTNVTRLVRDLIRKELESVREAKANASTNGAGCSK